MLFLMLINHTSKIFILVIIFFRCRFPFDRLYVYGEYSRCLLKFPILPPIFLNYINYVIFKYLIISVSDSPMGIFQFFVYFQLVLFLTCF